jgi:ceramide glucosyltransferase
VLEAGLRAQLSLDIIENRNTDCSVLRSLERHTRWAKMRRSLHPLGFFFEPLLSPVVVTTGCMFLAPSKVTLLLLGLAVVMQSVCAQLSARALRGRPFGWWCAPLEVLRSYVATFCWLRAWGSRRIEWRGHPFLLHRGSLIVPLADEAESRRAGFAA